MKMVMKRMMWLGAAIGFIGIGSGAMAQGRPLTTGMACDQARSLVAAQGAAVLSTSPTTYDRYVASGAYCASGETPDRGGFRQRMLPGAWSARAAYPSVAAADLDAWRIAALEVTSVTEGACGREALHSIMDRIASP
jgi:drug/metabolite transporter (DMT)-like permease